MNGALPSCAGRLRARRGQHEASMAAAGRQQLGRPTREDVLDTIAAAAPRTDGRMKMKSGRHRERVRASQLARMQINEYVT